MPLDGAERAQAVRLWSGQGYQVGVGVSRLSELLRASEGMAVRGRGGIMIRQQSAAQIRRPEKIPETVCSSSSLLCRHCRSHVNLLHGAL
jgi:hypothetical protein